MSEQSKDQMTAVAYQCPNCSAGIDVDEEFLGKTIECPQCSMAFKPKIPIAEPVMPAAIDGQDRASEFQVSRPSDDENNLLTSHPAVFRQHLLQTIGIALFVVGAIGAYAVSDGGSAYLVGVVASLVAAVAFLGYRWLEKIATTLSVTNKRTKLREGIISKSTTEVQHDDVRNLQVHQNILQRLLGIGDIAISSSGQDDLEIFAYGIPQPNGAAELIRKLQ